MPILNYFKETQAELRHVAWPTRTQTIVFTGLVIGISLSLSLYLGFFDFLFTSTLARFAGVQQAAPAQTAPVSTSTASGASSTSNVDFSLPGQTQGNTQQQ